MAHLPPQGFRPYPGQPDIYYQETSGVDPNTGEPLRVITYFDAKSGQQQMRTYPKPRPEPQPVAPVQPAPPPVGFQGVPPQPAPQPVGFQGVPPQPAPQPTAPIPPQPPEKPQAPRRKKKGGLGVVVVLLFLLVVGAAVVWAMGLHKDIPIVQDWDIPEFPVEIPGLTDFSGQDSRNENEHSQNVNEDSQNVNGGNPTLDREETLVMGTNAYYDPYIYYEGNEIVGIEVEIAQAIADELGLTLVIEDMEYDVLVSTLQAQEIDVILAGMRVTESRELLVHYTDVYATNTQVVVVHEDEEVVEIQDFSDRGGRFSIGVLDGSNGEINAVWEFEYSGMSDIVRFDTWEETLDAVSQGEVDCAIIDGILAEEYAEAHDEVRILTNPLVEEDFAIAIHLDDHELQEDIEAVLAELLDDGTIDEIVDSYIRG